MKLKYYDRYAQQMMSLGRGLALWEPQPNNKHKRVEIADVGYMQCGHFLCLFNAALPIGDPRNTLGVPEDYEPLFMDNDDPSLESLPARQPLCSTDVRVLGGNVNFSAQMPVLGPGASLQAKIVTSTGSGAMLLTGHDILSRDTALSLRFENYIKRNHQSWLKFARMLGRRVELEDLILVTGRHVTDDFAILSFFEAARDVEIGLSIDLPTVGSGSVAFSVGSRYITSPDVNYGPRITAPSDMSLIDDAPEEEGDGDRFTQCVFLRGYRVKKRLGFVKMKAAAGPHELGFDTREEEDESLCVEEGSSGDLEFVSDTTPTIDPTHSLLHYILNSSEAPLAIVHDKDVAGLYMSYPIGLQEDLDEVLRRIRPELDVNDGVGRVIPHGPSSKAFSEESRNVYHKPSVRNSEAPLATSHDKAGAEVYTGSRQLPSLREALGDFLEPKLDDVGRLFSTKNLNPVLVRPFLPGPSLGAPASRNVYDKPIYPAFDPHHSRGSSYSLPPLQSQSSRERKGSQLGVKKLSSDHVFGVYTTTPTGALVLERPGSQDEYKQRPLKSAVGERTREYICNECGELFERPSALEMHNRSHTGEKPFQCRHPGCGKKFTAGGNRARHERIHDSHSAFQERDGEEGQAGSSSSSKYSSGDKSHYSSSRRT